jgi:hypothetical protein
MKRVDSLIWNLKKRFPQAVWTFNENGSLKTVDMRQMKRKDILKLSEGLKFLMNPETKYNIYYEKED